MSDLTNSKSINVLKFIKDQLEYITENNILEWETVEEHLCLLYKECNKLSGEFYKSQLKVNDLFNVDKNIHPTNVNSFKNNLFNATIAYSAMNSNIAMVNGILSLPPTKPRSQSHLVSHMLELVVIAIELKSWLNIIDTIYSHQTQPMISPQ